MLRAAELWLRGGRMRTRAGRAALRRSFGAVTAGLVLVTTVVGVAPTAGAAVAFSGTLAGPSTAAMYPSGVEYDDSGDRLVIADTGLDRVLFTTYDVDGSPSFQPQGGFGGHGAGEGQFDSPRDVAIDSAGNIYVGDAGNNRVQSFTSDGTFRWQQGGTGTCDTCMNTPIGVTWDETNDVLLVASTGHDWIKALDADGSFAWKLPPGAGTNGVVDPGELDIDAPRDVARGPDGRLWVADYPRHRIAVFDVDAGGEVLDGNGTAADGISPAFTLGSNGNGEGNLNFPYNVDFSLDGSVAYVSDTGNGRVARWDISVPGVPTWLAPIGARCGTAATVCPDPPDDWGTIDTLRRVVVDPSGNLVTADFWGNGLQVWKSQDVGNGTTEAMLLQIELFAAPLPGAAQAFGVATGPGGEVYLMDRLNQRVQYFDPSGAFGAWGGGRGTAQGRFSWPEAVAVGPDGTVWAADTRGGYIQRWPEALSERSAFRRGGSGSAVGRFNYIEDLDVAPDGRVFVADTRNDRIQIYDPATDPTPGTASGTSGISVFPAATALVKPQGIAVTSEAIYVADTGNGRILRFDSSGAETARSTTALQAPEGVAVGPDGSVWVADTGNHRVVHLSAALEDLGHTFGTHGAGDLGFELPHTLDVAADAGTLYVADTFNHRVQTFDVSSLEPGGTGGGIDPAFRFHVREAGGVAPLYPAGGASAPDGVRYVADSGGSRIVAIRPNGNQRVVSPSGDGWNDPRDLELDVRNAKRLWVADTSNSRVVLLHIDGTILRSIGGPSLFTTPYGLANDRNGVYVADTYNHRVVKLAKKTGQVLWSRTACAGVDFRRPRDVTVATNGDIYVADTDNHRIVRMRPSGACVSTFGSNGTAPGQLRSPRALVSDGRKGLWVAEGGNHRIQRFRLGGAYVAGSAIGGFGSAKGKFRSAHCVFMDGRLVSVCDTFNFRIQRFRLRDGGPRFHSLLGGRAPAQGGFNGAFAVAYGPDGSMYAADWFNHRIQKFDAQGNVVWARGRYGTPGGSFIFPRGVLVDGGTLIVTDSENNRIDLLSASTGAFQSFIRPSGTNLLRPHQTALAPNGDFWVADTGNGRVLRIAPNGTVVANSQDWPTSGQITSPRGIATDIDGRVYVSSGNRVLRFPANGASFEVLATFGDGPAQVRGPYGLKVVGSGTGAMLLIADHGNDRVVVLDLDGAPIARFGSSGGGAGQFRQPRGADLSPTNGDLAVADFGNNRLSIWST